MQAHSKVKDNYRYILTFIDFFSKFLREVPLKSKTGLAVTSSFQSVFKDTKYSSSSSRKRPVWVRTDKGKEFLNTTFQDILKHEKIEFQVCRNPDAKCAIVERVKRTLRDKIFKNFTYSNSHKYIDVLPKFVTAYNTMHRSTGMAPSKVTDSDVLAISKRMKVKRNTTRTAKPKLRVGQHVRMSKAKMQFAKGGEQNYTTEIFKVKKVIYSTPRPVYELEDLNETLIEGQFYGEELSPVRISESTEYKIDKILDKRVRACILEFPVRWKGYSKAFESWVPASRVRNI
jgi:hypothetical protein